MAHMGRRDALKRLSSLPLAVGFSVTAGNVLLGAEHAKAALAAAKAGTAYRPRFFSPHEWETVRLLVDLIIPRDERSGSATDAGVPEFMDFIMTDPVESDHAREHRQTAMRGGLAWIDAECVRRSGRDFVSSSESERKALLDEIAYLKASEQDDVPDPKDLTVHLKHGPSFFASFRDLTASGFWSSRMGVEDLAYKGNVFAPDWRGCPPEVLRKLGLDV